ncbi:MAG: methylmalonyl-CoA mutase family protein [SAR324 cluster bacterium]|nr:methylmalonyl-CoA mutase family protein [SAR324 cluster bacterium]
MSAVIPSRSSVLNIELKHHVRFITATSLFDGHDAAINIMRRLLQKGGVEVVHLGHNRGVEEIVNVAIQEDAQAIAISSYQGGHIEFFKYMIDLLKEKGAGHIKVFGGGGGVIIPQEIKLLMEYGVARIYSPEDGKMMGLEGMIADMIQQSDFSTLADGFIPDCSLLNADAFGEIARCITWIEQHMNQPAVLQTVTGTIEKNIKIPIIGMTGTGGAGKSCLTDEILRRVLLQFDNFHIAVVSVDPSKRKTGGALLGDRIRMNAIDPQRVYMRSVATRRANLATSASIHEIIKVLSVSGFDMIFVETAGIGQSDSDISDLVDVSIYAMTPEFGAATQLEKIDMLDFADLIVINKSDKRSAEDALIAVRKQYRRNHGEFEIPDEELPVFGTVASRFNDGGVNQFYQRLISKVIEVKQLDWQQDLSERAGLTDKTQFIPVERSDYLREIAASVRQYKKKIRNAAEAATACYQSYGTLEQLKCHLPEPLDPIDIAEIPKNFHTIAELYNKTLELVPLTERQSVTRFQKECEQYQLPQYEFSVRQKTIVVDNHTESLSGTKIPKVAVPHYRDWGSILQWMGLENFPGSFPFTGGGFPFKRQNEDPTRMFAGEGSAERTNQRFHYLSANQPAIRLSTAFDSVTLYGEDPHPRPDIYGKVGNAGVSICTVDDAKRLYSGFDLCQPSTSVSMTINGPAPIILAFFLNTVIDQQVEIYLEQEGAMEKKVQEIAAMYQQQGLTAPCYRSNLPEAHNGLGLKTLGISGDQLVSPEIYQKIKQDVLKVVRGTVQADILKEDQAQNTCIFSTEFALKMMGDIQEYFTVNQVKNFYSVSISGYHIAEAGANPITQVALTLANGFTFIEHYLSRGLSIDQFAHNLSFFFSNGMDPEYAVIGRVARRIFAVTLRDRYQANERSQKLKYHIQTSGRSLHAQEIDFNDIRTTLQALYAIYDNCNSLHTNAYDEAITTPTEESVRRAVAIQLIINRELGLAKNENSLQGSFVVEELTDLVEEAILSEFIRISERGGVLGAMETMYQRNKIQEESLYYESLKHSGKLPIIGVNTFLNPHPVEMGDQIELMRSTEEEKENQLKSLAQFHQFHHAQREMALEQLAEACGANKNIFETLMETVKVCSLGQISRELYRFGGQYRRNM